MWFPHKAPLQHAAQIVHGALGAAATTVQHVRIDYRRPSILVPEQFLHCSDIVSMLEQMGGKRVSQRMASSPFGRSSLHNGPSEGLPENGFIGVMPSFLTRRGVLPTVLLGKDPLQDSPFRGVRIFPIQSIRHQNRPPTVGQVPLMDLPDSSQVFSERRLQRFRRTASAGTSARSLRSAPRQGNLNWCFPKGFAQSTRSLPLLTYYRSCWSESIRDLDDVADESVLLQVN